MPSCCIIGLVSETAAIRARASPSGTATATEVEAAAARDTVVPAPTAEATALAALAAAATSLVGGTAREANRNVATPAASFALTKLSTDRCAEIKSDAGAGKSGGDGGGNTESCTGLLGDVACLTDGGSSSDSSKPIRCFFSAGSRTSSRSKSTQPSIAWSAACGNAASAEVALSNALDTAPCITAGAVPDVAAGTAPCASSGCTIE